MQTYGSGCYEVLSLPSYAHCSTEDKEGVRWLQAAATEISDKLQVCKQRKGTRRLHVTSNTYQIDRAEMESQAIGDWALKLRRF